MADCPNLATASDVQNIMAAIAQLNAKIPTEIATKSDIAGLNSQIAQLTERVRSLEAQLSTTEQQLAEVKSSQANSSSQLANIPNWLDGLWAKISGFFEQIGSAIANSAQWVWDKVGDAAQWVWDAVKGVGSAVVDTSKWVWDKVGDSAQWVWDKVQGIGAIVTSSAQWVWDKIENSAGFLAEKIGGVVGYVADKVQDVSNFLGGKIGDVVGYVVDKAQWLWDKLDNVSGFLEGKLDGVGFSLSSIAGKFEGFFGKISDFFGGIWDFLRQIADVQMRIVDAIVNEFLRVFDWLIDLRDRIYRAVFEAVWEPIRWLWDQIFGQWANGNPTGGGSGTGGSSCNAQNVDFSEITDDLQYLRDELDKLNGFVLGGLDSEQSVALNPEAEMRSLLGSLFSGDMMGNSAKNVASLKEMLLAIAAVGYGRAGYQDYPISVPVLPLDNTPSYQNIVTASRFASWQTKFIDHGIGAFPFEIKVEDSDLIKTGNQTITGKFPNISESLAELIGLTITNKALGELNSEIGFRILGDVGGTKKQGFVSYKLLEAIADYLGFKTKQKTEKIGLSYNPLVGIVTGTDRLSEALKPTEIDIVIEEEDEKRSLEEKLELLLEAARIVKAVHFRKIGQDGIEELKQFFKDVASNEDDQIDFDTFIEEFEQGFTQRANLTDNLNPYGRSFDRRPKVRELGDQSDNPTQTP